MATEQKSIVLILARELASNVATPIFVVDRRGFLVFYNEPAEALIGTPFAQVGEVPALEWGTVFEPQDLDGRPVTLETMPPTIAHREHRAAHRAVSVITAGGVRRRIHITAFPLFSRPGELAGTIAIFWEQSSNGSGALDPTTDGGGS